MEPSCYLFKGDSYDTPENAPKSLLFSLLGHSRWYFYWYNFGIFCRTGKAGRNGVLTQEAQIRYSNENLRLVERCGGKIHVRGLDHLRQLNGQPAVLMGNHMSLLETALFHSLIRGVVDFTFVIKQSLLEVPYFKDIMLSLNAIPVGRENPRDDLRAVLGDGKRLLGEGKSIIIFPQATRSEVFNPAKFNSIGIKLAKSAGVPVVPFALKTDFLQNGKYLRDMGAVRPDREIWFEFAEPRMVEGNGQQLQQEIVDFIQNRLNCWRAGEQKR